MEFCVRHRVHPCPPHQTDLAIDVDLRGSVKAIQETCEHSTSLVDTAYGMET